MIERKLQKPFPRPHHWVFDIIKQDDTLAGGKSVLQVGARPSGGWHRAFQSFSKVGYEIFDVLEIFSKNVKNLKGALLRRVVKGDVRHIDRITELDNSYDIIYWWHGPEHVTKPQFEKVLPKLIERANMAVIVGCPHGKWVQPGNANKNEKHEKHWSPEEFEAYGFDVYAIGKIHTRHGMFGILRTYDVKEV
jgi:hypothetical protein